LYAKDSCERYSALLVIEEMQIKATERCHYIPVRIIKLKIVSSLNTGKNTVDYIPYRLLVEYTWHSPSGKQFGSFS
jgi:hypothetical protein